MNALVQTQLQMFVAAPGKCAQLHALWQQTATAEGVAILARKDAVKLGEMRGFNPATARTQFQVWFKRHAASVAASIAVAASAPVETPDAPSDPVETPTDAPAVTEPSQKDEPAPVMTRAQRRAAAKSERDAAVV